MNGNKFKQKIAQSNVKYYGDGGIINTTPPKKTIPPTIKLEDKRKVNATSGQPINPNVDLVSGNYSTETITNLINAAQQYNINPYTALAVGLQETKLGKSDYDIGHVLYGAKSAVGWETPEEQLALSLKENLEKAKRLKITDEAHQIQVYNGRGTITPKTEKKYHGYEMKKAYGVTIPKEGLNMKKTPLYGQRIQDLRDNVIVQNPDIVKQVIKTGYNPFSGKYEPSTDYYNQMVYGKHDLGGYIQQDKLSPTLNNYLNSDMNKYAQGGQLTQYNVGGTHEQNPNGGIPLGGDASVEQGETRKGNYIYSDRIPVDKQKLKEYGLPNPTKKDMTFADYTKYIESKFKDRNDKASLATKKEFLDRTTQYQEAIKAEQAEKEARIQQAMALNSQKQAPAFDNQEVPEGMEEFAYGGATSNQELSDSKIQGTWESTKDAAASVPILGIFRGAEKAGKAGGQAIGGNEGGDIAGGFLDPMQNVFSKDTSASEKTLAVADPVVSGIITARTNDQKRQAIATKNAMNANQQVAPGAASSGLALGGYLRRRYDDGGYYPGMFNMGNQYSSDIQTGQALNQYGVPTAGGVSGATPGTDFLKSTTGVGGAGMPNIGGYAGMATTGMDLFKTAQQGGGTRDMATGIGTGFLKGAAAGSAAGPWGAAIMGVAGGIAGGLGAKKEEKKFWQKTNKDIAMANNAQPNSEGWTGVAAAYGGSINIKPSHRGLLHENLGIPQGQPIPASSLAIHEGDSETLRKQKQFAINAKSWRHATGGPIYGNEGYPLDARDPMASSQSYEAPYSGGFETPGYLYLKPNQGSGFDRALFTAPYQNGPTVNMDRYKHSAQTVADPTGGRLTSSEPNKPIPYRQLPLISQLLPPSNAVTNPPKYGNEGLPMRPWEQGSSSLATDALVDEVVANNSSTNSNQFGKKAGDFVGTHGSDLLRAYPIISNLLQKPSRPGGTYYSRLSDSYNVPAVDETRSLRELNNLYSNKVRALGQMGGSQAQQRAGLLGLSASQKDIVGKTMQDLEQARISRAMQEQQFKTGVAQYNAGATDRGTEAYRQDLGNYEAMKSKLTGQIGTDIGLIGKEQTHMKQVAAMYGYDWNGKYMVDKKTGLKADPATVAKINKLVLDTSPNINTTPATVAPQALGGYITRRKAKY